MKRNSLKNKIDRLAGMLILLNFIIIGTLAVAGFVFGFRFENVKEVLLFALPLIIIIAITVMVMGLSEKERD